MRRILINILLTVAVALTAHAQGGEPLTVKVGNFTRIALLDDIAVDYRCNADSAGLAIIDCSREVANHLMFSLSDKERLSIQVDDRYERQGNLPKIIIYSSALEEAENAGDSTLRIAGLPPMKSFKVSNTDNGKIILKGVRASKLELQILSGKGKIIADGSCDDLELRLIGTGEIQADQVQATNVSCRIMGTGSMGCFVDGGNLKVNGCGTGKVYYKGVPSKVTVHKLGTIKAIPMQ